MCANKAMVSLERVLSDAEQRSTIDPAVWHWNQTDEVQLKAMLNDHLRDRLTLRARAARQLGHRTSQICQGIPHRIQRAG